MNLAVDHRDFRNAVDSAAAKFVSQVGSGSNFELPTCRELTAAAVDQEDVRLRELEIPTD